MGEHLLIITINTVGFFHLHEHFYLLAQEVLIDAEGLNVLVVVGLLVEFL